MTKQMLKLVWNRKWSNGLIVVEIFFSFLVLFAVVTAAAYYVDNRRHPLGFSYRDVWNINVSSVIGPSARTDDGRGEKMRQLMATLRGLPEIEAVGAMTMTPFQVGASQTTTRMNNRQSSTYFNGATDGLKNALGIQIVRGRWFEESDDALNYEPVVINERLSGEVFPGEDPIGKPLFSHREGKERRIVGVFTDFRQHGEFHSLYNYHFQRLNLAAPGAYMPNNIVVKLRPGVTAAFEEKLMKTLQGADRDRSFKIEPLSKLRASHMKLVLAPLAAGAVVALFLILMVGLGMVGVLWQSVTRRSREIGLRRAVGSDGNGIYKQVLGELLVVISAGLALGAGLAVQFPLLGIFGFLSAKVYTTGIAGAAAIIYAIGLLAGLYPSWLATQVQPAEVLHHE